MFFTLFYFLRTCTVRRVLSVNSGNIINSSSSSNGTVLMMMAKERSYHLSHVTSFRLNRVRCDWPQPLRTGSYAVKRPSLPWLQPITGYTEHSVVSDEVRSHEVR